MSMRHLVRALAGALVCWAGAASGSQAQAMKLRLSPLPERVAQSDAVVIGKVTDIEKKTVRLGFAPGDEEKMEYQVAIIKIEDAPVGAKGVTDIRVAFLPPQAGRGGPPRPGIRRGPAVTITKGQEGCFFLLQHYKEPLYLLNQAAPSLDPKSDNYKKEIEQVKHYATLLSQPNKGLTAKDADERVQTAGLLIAHYRMFRPGPRKEEPIDAEQSKLILKALADADFTKPYSPNEINAQQAFFQLNLTEKDGWKPPPFKNFQKEFPPVVKKWLTENADKYRVKQVVVEKK